MQPADADLLFFFPKPCGILYARVVEYGFLGGKGDIPTVAYHIYKFCVRIITADERHVVEHKSAFAPPPFFAGAFQILRIDCKEYIDEVVFLDLAEYPLPVDFDSPWVGMQFNHGRHITDNRPTTLILIQVTVERL